ncbi:TonB-dependent siderophore receptor [Shinella sp.]|uniref:TonB-dependent siderophore receptor n=1 Tax=Shinella sp. TaxID=1870904 RepID=UPI003F72ABAA
MQQGAGDLGDGGWAVFPQPEPYNFERLEILKGPASVLYGANSPGGLVNVVSKRPTEEARGEVVLEVGSHDRIQEQIDISGPLDADGTLLYQLVGVNRNADTQVDFQPDEHRFLAPSLTWKPDEDTSLTLLGQYSPQRVQSLRQAPLQLCRQRLHHRCARPRDQRPAWL